MYHAKKYDQPKNYFSTVKNTRFTASPVLEVLDAPYCSELVILKKAPRSSLQIEAFFLLLTFSCKTRFIIHLLLSISSSSFALNQPRMRSCISVYVLVLFAPRQIPSRGLLAALRLRSSHQNHSSSLSTNS